MSKWNRKAPFDAGGNLLHYAGGCWISEPEWRDADKVFKARLHYVTFQRGRSSTYFVFEDRKTKAQYPG